MEMHKGLVIPIHHISPADKDSFYNREDFFYHYQGVEEGEIGCVFDLETGKPIMRVVCDAAFSTKYSG